MRKTPYTQSHTIHTWIRDDGSRHGRHTNTGTPRHRAPGGTASYSPYRTRDESGLGDSRDATRPHARQSPRDGLMPAVTHGQRRAHPRLAAHGPMASRHDRLVTRTTHHARSHTNTRTHTRPAPHTHDLLTLPKRRPRVPPPRVACIASQPLVSTVNPNRQPTTPCPPSGFSSAIAGEDPKLRVCDLLGPGVVGALVSVHRLPLLLPIFINEVILRHGKQRRRVTVSLAPRNATQKYEPRGARRGGEPRPGRVHACNRCVDVRVTRR